MNIYLSVILCTLAVAAFYTVIELVSERLSKRLEKRRNKKRWEEMGRLENRTPHIVIDTAKLQE